MWPSSAGSVGLGEGWRMSITSKCPISELKIALSFEPNGPARLMQPPGARLPYLNSL